MTNFTTMALQGLNSLWMLFFIMISAGLAKDYNLFAPAYAYVKNTFRANKFVVVILSAIGGILPIEGRVTVSAGLLDTVAPKCGHGREKLGIVDYLATHHYYLWSPLEKTVILPIAAFGITYTAWIYLVAPLIVVTFIYLTWYIWSQIKNEEVAVTPTNFKLSAVMRNVFPMFIAIGAYINFPELMIQIFGSLTVYYMFITQQWDLKKLSVYIKWDVLITVAVVIVLSSLIKTKTDVILDWAHSAYFDPKSIYGILGLSLVGFCITFLLGSSSKGVGVAILMSQLCGTEYFLWFFALDFAGYILSPSHKCVAIGHKYFGTLLSTYYKALGSWALLLVTTAGIYVFVVSEYLK
jgi:hypothetical protein